MPDGVLQAIEHLTPGGARKAEAALTAAERELYALWTILLRSARSVMLNDVRLAQRKGRVVA